MVPLWCHQMYIKRKINQYPLYMTSMFYSTDHQGKKAIPSNSLVIGPPYFNYSFQPILKPPRAKNLWSVFVLRWSTCRRNKTKWEGISCHNDLIFPIYSVVKFLHGGVAIHHLRMYGEIFERELKLPGQVDYGRKCERGKCLPRNFKEVLHLLPQN